MKRLTRAPQKLCVFAVPVLWLVLASVSLQADARTNQDPANQNTDQSSETATPPPGFVSKGTTPNWYSEQGELVFPSQLQRDFLDGRSQSVKPPTAPRPPRNTKPWFTGDWFVGLQYVWISLLIGIACLALSLLVYYLVRNSEFFASLRRASRSKSEDELTEAKISDLPFNIDKPVAGLLDEANAARQRGDFSRAIIYLFSHVLMELDRNRRIRLQRGKTNHMYLREIKHDAELRRITERIMLAFEWVFFGRHELSEKNFYACWNSLEEFSRRLTVNASEAVSPPSAALPSSTGGVA